MNRTRNIIIFVAVVAVVILFAVFAERGNHQSGLPVQIVTVKYGPFSVKLAENGVVMRPRTETIPTLVAGNIGSINVREGQHVTAGELLATISNPTLMFQAEGSQADYNSSVANVNTAQSNRQNAEVQYRAQAETAKSSLDLAQQVYNEDVALFANQAIPRNQLENDRAKLEQAQVTYDQAVQQVRIGAVSGYGQDSLIYAQANAHKSAITNAQDQQQLASTQIVAPFDGIIQTIATNTNDALRFIQVGDPVTAGQALFTIAASDNYIVRAEVDEQDIINVHVGQRALVSGEDFPGKTIPGHVSQIAPVATKSTDANSTAKQVLTTIVLDTSPSYLKDGMTADVDILTTDMPRALTVPNGAVVTQGSSSYVFVVVNSVARKRNVKIGAVSDTQTVILSGLQAGDKIVGQQNPGLTDGARVEALPNNGLPNSSSGATSGSTSGSVTVVAPAPNAT